MKKPMFKVIVAGLLALPMCVVFAQDGKGKGKGKGPGFQPPQFSEVDTDESGDIDLAEWTAFHTKRAERAFGFLSGDDDVITEDEMKRLSRRGGPGGDRGGKGKGKGGDGKGKGSGERRDDDGGTRPKRPAIEE